MALNAAFDRLKADVTTPSINMAPLIDMVFLLLIFYVVTTTFNHETGIPLKKAQAESAVLLVKHQTLIIIDKNGLCWIEDQSYDIRAAVKHVLVLRQQRPEAPLIILPDREGIIDPMIQLLDKLRNAGITDFALGAEKRHGN